MKTKSLTSPATLVFYFYFYPKSEGSNCKLFSKMKLKFWPFLGASGFSWDQQSHKMLNFQSTFFIINIEFLTLPLDVRQLIEIMHMRKLAAKIVTFEIHKSGILCHGRHKNLNTYCKLAYYSYAIFFISFILPQFVSYYSLFICYEYIEDR